MTFEKYYLKLLNVQNMTSLAVASSYCHTRLVWLSGHNGIDENCTVYELARKGYLPSGYVRADVLLSYCVENVRGLLNYLHFAKLIAWSSNWILYYWHSSAKYNTWGDLSKLLAGRCGGNIWTLSSCIHTKLKASQFSFLLLANRTGRNCY